METESDGRKITNHDFIQGQGIPPPCVKSFHSPRLRKPRRGLLIFGTQVDFCLESYSLKYYQNTS